MRSPRRKRSLRREIIKDVDREVLIELARRVVYVGSPEHKDVIGTRSGDPGPCAAYGKSVRPG